MVKNIVTTDQAVATPMQRHVHRHVATHVAMTDLLQEAIVEVLDHRRVAIQEVTIIEERHAAITAAVHVLLPEVILQKATTEEVAAEVTLHGATTVAHQEVALQKAIIEVVVAEVLQEHAHLALVLLLAEEIKNTF